MRIALVMIVTSLLLAPALASATSPGRCRQLNHRIGHFEAMEQRADQLGNDIWKDRFHEHLASLKAERKTCPGYSDSEVAAAQMRELLKLAAQGAITFFTMGMGPGF
jgi:hypothetical protein